MGEPKLDYMIGDRDKGQLVQISQANEELPVRVHSALVERLAFGISIANAALTVSTPIGRRIKLAWATIAYSAAPTQTGVTVTLDSGLGSGFDTTLITGTADVRYSYIDFEGLTIGPDDEVDILAPAAGGAITASVQVYGELLS